MKKTVTSSTRKKKQKKPSAGWWDTFNYIFWVGVALTACALIIGMMILGCGIVAGIYVATQIGLSGLFTSAAVFALKTAVLAAISTAAVSVALTAIALAPWVIAAAVIMTVVSLGYLALTRPSVFYSIGNFFIALFPCFSSEEKATEVSNDTLDMKTSAVHDKSAMPSSMNQSTTAVINESLPTNNTKHKSQKKIEVTPSAESKINVTANNSNNENGRASRASCLYRWFGVQLAASDGSNKASPIPGK